MFPKQNPAAPDTELTDGYLHASQSQNNALALLHHFPGITNDGRGAVKPL